MRTLKNCSSGPFPQEVPATGHSGTSLFVCFGGRRDRSFGLSLSFLEEFERGLLQLIGLALQGDSPDGIDCSGVQSIWSGGTVFGNQGVRVPDDLSLICADSDVYFHWRDSKVASFRFDGKSIARHLLRWASKISKGEEYCRQIRSKAGFVGGGTVGPAPRSF